MPKPRAHSLDDFEPLARAVLPRAVFDFYAGGAGAELTLRRNRTAFDELQLRPQVLCDVGDATTETPLLGRPAAAPVIVAPMGAVGFGRRGGDVDLARAAGRAGLPYTLSAAATASIEEIADVAGDRRWFQLYPLKRREVMWDLVARAHAARFEALVVTVDVPVGGQRLRDLRNDFSMPFRFTRRNLLDFASRPRWALRMLRHGLPTMPSLAPLAAKDSDARAVASSVGAGFDSRFGWDDLREVRRRWTGPLVLKGVLRPDDALRAQRLGCDAIVVSNHGGRQLDTALASLDALPAIADALDGRLEIYLDGGVRRGTDILKAVALGARAVMVGRPLLYGACAAGEAGAALAMRLLVAELHQALQLSGAADLLSLPADLTHSPKTKETPACTPAPGPTASASPSLRALHS